MDFQCLSRQIHNTGKLKQRGNDMQHRTARLNSRQTVWHSGESASEREKALFMIAEAARTERSLNVDMCSAGCLGPG